MKKDVLTWTVSAIVLITMGSGTLPSGGYKVGDVVADFNLKNVTGKMVSLSGLSDNKGAIVIFTCNHCPFSVAYEDRIIALNERYAPKGYPVIAINPNDEVKVPEDSFRNMIRRAK
jgi:thiol-disulfide isomerase/thioredoxin